MRRLLNLVLVGLMVAGAAYTFEIKRRAEGAAEKVVKIERQIVREKEAIEVLSLIHISEPTDQRGSRMPSSA